MDSAATREEIGDLRQWEIATSSQFRHHLRTYRFLGLLGFVVAVSVATVVLDLHAGTPLVRLSQLASPDEYLANDLSFAPLIAILAAAFFGGDALSEDFASGNGYFTLVLPVNRPVLLAGRYAAAILASGVIVGAFYLIGGIGAACFFPISSIPWGLVAGSAALALLFTVAAIAVAFCLSAFLRSPSAGVLVTVLVLYVGFTVVQQVAELAGFEPWWSFTYAGGALTAMIDPNFVHVQVSPLGHGQSITTWSAYFGEGALIMVAYLFVFLALSIVLYETKESTG